MVTNGREHNMDIQLREYQQRAYDETWLKLFKNGTKKVVVSMPTGSGKSVVIGKLASELPGRTLILTHRIEILQQNSEWLNNCSVLTSKHDGVRFDSKIVVAMVQTLYARLEKYGMDYIGKIDNIILDEVHVLIFQKVFEKYDFNKLIGFTGTPVLSKNIYTNIDGVEYVEPYTLSEIFDDIVCGPDTQELIDLGYLVQDYNIALKLPDFDKLKESSSDPDGYTKKSLNQVYKNTASLNILSEAFEKHCKGKKTLIFNASTTINKFVYDHFKKKGLNVKVFDTVNNPGINPKTGRKYKREEIIEWFSNERDAILVNTNVFTTGFNVTDVEVVVVNRATKSLALWIQMVGRGSRTTTNIFKDKFTVVDLGQNIFKHGIWSKPRNWERYFHKQGKRLVNKQDMLSTWECEECGSLTVTGELECCVCGAEKKKAIINGVGKKLKEGQLEIIDTFPDPKAKSILAYTRHHGETSNFAFKLLEERIIEMFLHYQVKREFYILRHANFRKRIEKIFKPIYSAIIRSELKGSNRKYDTQLNKMFKVIDKCYNYDN